MHTKANRNAPLFDLLLEMAPDSSKNTLRSWIEEGRIEIDGNVVRSRAYQVRKGQEIQLGRKKHFIQDSIEIIYEDADLVVLYKPAGVLSVATDFNQKYNVHTYLKRRFHSRRVFPVHRLDREVSGVMVFAYSSRCVAGLKEQFEEHSILREYLAIVEGDVEQDMGTWQSYLQEDPTYVVKSIKDKGLGQLATTHYAVIQRKHGMTSLRITLETGKKNQIRVHCAEAGHPIAGDTKYKAKTDPVHRLGLHAWKLGFFHPGLEKNMLFERNPDPIFRKYLA